MTHVLQSVQRIGAREVLVAFSTDGPMRNILLRDQSEFAVPETHQAAYDDALAKEQAIRDAATAALAKARDAYDAESDKAAAIRTEGYAKFSLVAEVLARQQMAKEDAPPVEAESAEPK